MPAELPVLKEQTSPPHVGERRLDWAALLQRVFAVDALACQRCGGRMKIIAFITDSLVAAGILDHLGLPSTPPTAEPARAPPEPAFDASDPTFDDLIC